MDPTQDPTLIDESGGPAVTSLPAAARDRAPGDVLDRRYRLHARLGRGGFGDVWRAEELLPDGAPFREVALKLLVADFADAAHWTKEAKLLASFRHPSLVTIYAAGILQEPAPAPFVAMELLEGSTLAEVLKQRSRIPWRRVLAWARDVAAALDVIHARGVVHLDLKPANLFLSADGAVKVLDFGISRQSGAPPARPLRASPRAAAKETPDDEAPTTALASGRTAFAATRPAPAPDATAAGRTARGVVGTPGFIAPEVIELAAPSAATDAYALAVCVVQLATGRLPHDAPDEPRDWSDPTSVSSWWFELREATLRGAIRDLAADPARLPRGLLSLLQRLLAVDPAARGVAAGGLRALIDEVWERPHGVPDPPYFGLAPLPITGEGLLFGRDEDLGRLGRELEFEPAVVLVGGRGVGKTSLARAGLASYLARRHVDQKDDWIAVVVRPEGDPDAALAAALGEVAPELAGADFDYLARWSALSPVGLALVVDPLEELAPAKEERAGPGGGGPARSVRVEWAGAALSEGDAATRDTLLDLQAPASARPGLLEEACARLAAGERRPGLRLIGVIGEERAAALLEGPIGDRLRGALRYVGPPAAAAVGELCAAPARLGGAELRGIEPVTAEVQRELRSGASALPFVALALSAWWGARKVVEGRTILRGEAWRELGGVRGALARHADRTLAALAPPARAVAEEILLRLGAVDESPLRWQEQDLLDAVEDGAEPGRAAEVLAALEHALLVRRRAGAVEVAHPGLLTSWAHLRRLRGTHVQRLIVLERLREATDAWERSGCHADLLLRGEVLREVPPSGLTRQERELVRASRRRARWRLARRIGVGALIASLVAGGVGTERVMAQRQAEAEDARRGAEARAELSEIIEKSRRTEDPYARAAYLTEAMARGADDPMLPLDLTSAAAGVPRAHFLTLDPVSAPALPWDDRWVVAGGPGGSLFVADLWLSESVVIEDLELDDPALDDSPARFGAPVVHSLRVHEAPIVERVPFAFDTAVVTRSSTGEVRVVRLGQSGAPALAAIAPIRCSGQVRAAEAAPVIACSTDQGIARWDLRRGTGEPSVDRHAFRGIVLDVSPDGARVAAALDRRVLLWQPRRAEPPAEVELSLGAPAALGRWSPRDPVIALVEPGRIAIHAFSPGVRAKAPAPLIEIPVSLAPASARWDAGGLDFGLCSVSGAGAWHYLRRGGRAPEDAPPRGSPCAPPARAQQAEPLRSEREAPELAELEFGPHPLAGGFRLPDGRVLSRDLVLLSPSGPAAASLLRFRGRDEAGREIAPSAEGMTSAAAVLRHGDVVAWQIGGEVRLHDARDGRKLSAHQGGLLRRCDDGRIAAFRVDAAAGAWVLFNASARGGGDEIGRAPRVPGFLLGVDAKCRTLLAQALDGALQAIPLVAGAAAVEPRRLGEVDGYVHDARPSPARGDVGAGLLLASSSGAVARVDDATGEVRIIAYASPFATAIGDGPEPGDVAYADSTGVVLVRRSGAIEQALDAAGSGWEDLAVAPDGRTMLLSSGDRIAALDLTRRELLGSIHSGGYERLAPWDDEGSVLAWSFDRVGGAEGLVVPRGLSLVRRVAGAVSNLVVDQRRLKLR